MTSAERARNVVVDLASFGLRFRLASDAKAFGAIVQDEIDAAVAEALSARWVPVVERLPPSGLLVIAQTATGHQFTAIWFGPCGEIPASWRRTGDGAHVEGVVAWHRLPKPYRAQDAMYERMSCESGDTEEQEEEDA